VFLKIASGCALVGTAEREYLIRGSLRDISALLDPNELTQIYRSIAVALRAIEPIRRKRATARTRNLYRRRMQFRETLNRWLGGRNTSSQPARNPR
jgi:DNA-binding LytR/AlgR family response regulator